MYMHMHNKKMCDYLDELQIDAEIMHKYNLRELLLAAEIDKITLQFIDEDHFAKLFDNTNIPISVQALFQYKVCAWQKLQKSESDSDELLELLIEWGLEELYSTCIAQDINKKTLLIMTRRHCELLTKDFNLGVLIKLEDRLLKWQTASKSTVCNVSNILINDSFFQCNSSDFIDINTILMSSMQGRTILQKYNINSILTEHMRSIMLNLIINYLFQQNIKMSVNVASQIAEEIIKLFPNEAKDLYFLKHRGKVSGKIYSKYYNNIKSLRNCGILNKKCEEKESTTEIELFTSDIKESLDILQFNNLSWPDIEHHWTVTAESRLNFLINVETTTTIFNKWPQYKKQFGFKLIHIDFLKKYPEAANITFLTDFKPYYHKFFNLFESRLNGSSKEYFNLIKNQSLSENGQYASLFYLLHGVLVPKSYAITMKNNKKQHYRPSITDSRNSIFLIGKTPEEIETKLRNIQEKQKYIQPLILVEGSVTNPNEISIYFDGIKYKNFNILSAINTCFEIFHIFNIKYPLPSLLVWTFIQHYFYKIKTHQDKAFPVISSLSKDLNI